MSENKNNETTGASGVASSDMFDVLAVYGKMKKDLPYILDGICSELGETFIRPKAKHPALIAEDALYQLECKRAMTGPLQFPLSMHAMQLREIKQLSDGILAARLYKARGEREILSANSSVHASERSEDRVQREF